MIPYHPPKTMERIPLIDFSDARSPRLEDRIALARRVREACIDVGFFYLCNHGIAPADLEAQLEWTRRVFRLPRATLEAVSVEKSNCMHGYAGMGTQVLDADTPPDLKESFYIGVHMDEDHPHVKAGLPNCGPNQWPDLPGFREHCEKYFQSMSDLSRDVLRVIALSLELDERWFDPITGVTNSILRLLRYPPHPANARANQLGAGAHADWGGITLLLQDQSGGLEVRNAAGDWIRAEPVPGSLVVNLGNMMQRWTNDLYLSNMHRVLNNVSGGDRHSAAFFFNPDYYCRVECLPTCTGPGNPPRYPPVRYGDYLMHRLNKNYDYRKPEGEAPRASAG